MSSLYTALLFLCLGRVSERTLHHVQHLGPATVDISIQFHLAPTPECSFDEFMTIFTGEPSRETRDLCLLDRPTSQLAP